jgi:hypothetical protein
VKALPAAAIVVNLCIIAPPQRGMCLCLTFQHLPEIFHVQFLVSCATVCTWPVVEGGNATTCITFPEIPASPWKYGRPQDKGGNERAGGMMANNCVKLLQNTTFRNNSCCKHNHNSTRHKQHKKKWKEKNPKKGKKKLKKKRI